jgi:glycine cleavage system transcriptional repressor
VHVIALDNPGIVHEIANFFAVQNINIEAMDTNTYAAPHTGSPMFALSMTVNIPVRVHIATLRENFMIFCDDRNLDAIIEPYKA